MFARPSGVLFRLHVCCFWGPFHVSREVICGTSFWVSFGVILGALGASFRGLWGCLLGLWEVLGGSWGCPLGDSEGSWGRLGRPLDPKALRGRLWNDFREIPGDFWEPPGSHFGIILCFIFASTNQWKFMLFWSPIWVRFGASFC